jgi:hypothetical protein
MTGRSSIGRFARRSADSRLVGEMRSGACAAGAGALRERNRPRVRRLPAANVRAGIARRLSLAFAGARVALMGARLANTRDDSDRAGHHPGATRAAGAHRPGPTGAQLDCSGWPRAAVPLPAHLLRPDSRRQHQINWARSRGTRKWRPRSRSSCVRHFPAATFSPTDPLARILADLACPIGGYQDPGNGHNRITDHKMRILCTCCGSFITILVTDEQAQAMYRRSAQAAGASDRTGNGSLTRCQRDRPRRRRCGPIRRWPCRSERGSRSVENVIPRGRRLCSRV